MTTIKDFNTNPLTSLNQSAEAIIDSDEHFLRFGGDYYFGKNILGVLLVGSFYKEDIPQASHIIINQNDTEITSITRNQSNNKRDDLTLSLNYFRSIDTIGSNVSIDYEASKYKIRNSSNFSTEFIEDQSTNFLKSNNPNDANISSIQVELNKNFSDNSTLISGYKYGRTKIDNVLDFYQIDNGIEEINVDLSNSLVYKEYIHAFYSEYSGKLGTKTTYRLGIRLEDTKISRQQSNTIEVEDNYLDYFPSLSISYNMSNKHQLGFSYSRKISRPQYNDLNSFVYYVDPYTFIKGNPDLRPQYGNHFNIDYILKKRYYFSLFFNNVNDVFLQTPIQNDETITTSLQVDNLDYSNQYGLALSIPFNKLKWWNMNTSVLFYKKEFKYKTSNISNEISNSRNVFEFSQSNTFTLFGNLFFDISGYYVTPFVEGVYKKNELLSVSTSLRKSFLNDRLNLKLSLSDVFNSYEIIKRVNLINQNSVITQNFDTKRLSFSAIYSFMSGKKTKRKRIKNISNDSRRRI